MSICPANVWNHTSGCACAPGGTITAEAPGVDLMAGTAFDSRTLAMFMDEAEFDQMFGETIESPDGVAMWMDNPIDVDSTIAKDRVWSVIEGDQNDNLYLLPGDHPVNRTAWVVTEHAWGNPNIEVLWHDASEMDSNEATTAAEPAQVFGPGRPAAAASAIHEMHVARAEREANPWSEATHQRLRRAERIRDDYSEYGDTFTHH